MYTRTLTLLFLLVAAPASAEGLRRIGTWASRIRGQLKDNLNAVALIDTRASPLRVAGHPAAEASLFERSDGDTQQGFRRGRVGLVGCQVKPGDVVTLVGVHEKVGARVASVKEHGGEARVLLAEVEFMKPTKLAPYNWRGGQGTAFLVHSFSRSRDKAGGFNRGLVLTVGHANAQQGNIMRFVNNDLARVTRVLSQQYGDNDYALLEVEFKHPTCLKPIKMQTGPPNKRLAKVYYFGFPKMNLSVGLGRRARRIAWAIERESTPKNSQSSLDQATELMLKYFRYSSSAIPQGRKLLREIWSRSEYLRDKYSVVTRQGYTFPNTFGGSGSPIFDRESHRAFAILSSSHTPIARAKERAGAGILSDALQRIETDARSLPPPQRSVVNDWLRSVTQVLK